MDSSGATLHPENARLDISKQEISYPDAPCMDYLPTHYIDEKMNTFNFRGNAGKYYLHGASGIEFHHENQVLQTYNATWLLCRG